MASRRNKNAAINRQTQTNSEDLRRSEQWVRERIYGLEDQEVLWLIEQYIVTYKELLADVENSYAGGRLSPPALAQLLVDVENEVNALAARLTERLDPTMLDSFRQGYYGRAWLLDRITAAEWATSYNVLLPVEQINALLLQDYVGTSEWIDLERADLVSRLKKSLTRAMIAGEGVGKAAERLRNDLGVKSGQRSGFKGSAWRTLLIARTEIIRASNIGALTVYEQNQDVLKGWEWVATLDERTCPICGGLDGKVFKFGSDQPLPPSGSHPGCRCTIVPVLIDEALQDDIAGQRQTYDEWAAQRGIINDGGLAEQRGADAHGINATSARVDG
jgi:SPP1 gp7 family putative phage head morphogenesis protein